jgi:hypothetical protein
MQNIILSTFVLLLSAGSCFCQDLITKKTGEDIKAKISEITSTEIKYKKFDNLNGPTYSLDKSEVLLIKYENGTNVVMNSSVVRTDETHMNAISLMDAIKNGSISELVIEGGNNTLTISVNKKNRENLLSFIIPMGKTKLGFIENGAIKAGDIKSKRTSDPSGTSLEFVSLLEVDNLETDGFSIVMDEALMVNIPAGEYSKKFTAKGNLKIYIPEKYTGLVLTGLTGTITSGKIIVKRNNSEDKDKRAFEIQYGNMVIKEN